MQRVHCLRTACCACLCTQAGFKRELVKEVHAFVQDAQAFRRDWEANGPMVPGLDPMEAVDRLKKFQQMFEVGDAAAFKHACSKGGICIPVQPTYPAA